MFYSVTCGLISTGHLEYFSTDGKCCCRKDFVSPETMKYFSKMQPSVHPHSFLHFDLMVTWLNASKYQNGQENIINYFNSCFTQWCVGYSELAIFYLKVLADRKCCCRKKLHQSWNHEVCFFLNSAIWVRPSIFVPVLIFSF